MSAPIISLVLPCFNEAEHFVESIDHIFQVLTNLKQNFEIIFVDDKSQDNTVNLIQEFIKNHPRHTRSIYHTINQGRGFSVTEGIRLSRGKYVGFIDIDCEISPRYIPDCIKLLDKGFDLVCGQRRYKVTAYSLIRAIASKMYSTLTHILLHPAVADTEAGYKFFRREKILPVLKLTQDRGWFWDTEIIIRAQQAGLKIIGYDVNFIKRTDKTSTVNIFSDAFIYLFKLFKFVLS